MNYQHILKVAYVNYAGKFEKILTKSFITKQLQILKKLLTLFEQISAELPQNPVNNFDQNTRKQFFSPGEILNENDQ